MAGQSQRESSRLLFIFPLQGSSVRGRVGGEKGKPWDEELVPTAVATYPAFPHLPASYPGSFGSACWALAPREAPATGWVGPRQQFSSFMVHVSSVTRLSPGATSAPPMWASSPGLGSALFQARSPSSLLGLGFMLLPHASRDVQEEGLSSQRGHLAHLSPLGLRGHHMEAGTFPSRCASVWWVL